MLLTPSYSKKHEGPLAKRGDTEELPRIEERPNNDEHPPDEDVRDDMAQLSLVKVRHQDSTERHEDEL